MQGAAAGEGWWVFTGDTGPNPALWQRLRGMKVAQLVIETAFGDDERALAGISRHLCPSVLAAELAAFDGPLNPSVDVYITHIKPGEMAAVMAEIARIETPHRIHPLDAGQTMWLPGPVEASRAPGDKLRRQQRPSDRSGPPDVTERVTSRQDFTPQRGRKAGTAPAFKGFAPQPIAKEQTP